MVVSNGSAKPVAGRSYASTVANATYVEIATVVPFATTAALGIFVKIVVVKPFASMAVNGISVDSVAANHCVFTIGNVIFAKIAVEPQFVYMVGGGTCAVSAVGNRCASIAVAVKCARNVVENQYVHIENCGGVARYVSLHEPLHRVWFKSVSVRIAWSLRVADTADNFPKVFVTDSLL